MGRESEVKNIFSPSDSTSERSISGKSSSGLYAAAYNLILSTALNEFFCVSAIVHPPSVSTDVYVPPPIRNLPPTLIMSLSTSPSRIFSLFKSLPFTYVEIVFSSVSKERAILYHCFSVNGITFLPFTKIAFPDVPSFLKLILYATAVATLLYL